MLKILKKNKNKVGKIFSNANLEFLYNAFGKYNSRLFIVGGAVRNYLLGEDVKDFDIAVQLPPKELEIILDSIEGIKLNKGGKIFGCFKVKINNENFEFTSFRKDSYEEGSRFPKISYTDKIKDDAVRRDFTINSIYMDCRGKVIYPIKQSQIDLKNMELRFLNPVRESINNDPLRILRFLRFASEYEGFRMNKKDLRICLANKQLLKSISEKKKDEELARIRLGINAGLISKYLPK